MHARRARRGRPGMLRHEPDRLLLQRGDADGTCGSAPTATTQRVTGPSVLLA
jgi:hypothetical protein